MRIFVGGLPRTATKEDLVRLFKQFGAGDDDVVLPRDRRTRRRKGFAYVEIPDPAKAQAAVAVFAGFKIDDKELTVCLASERPPKRGRRAFAILAFLAASAFLALPASADVAQTDAAITFNPLVGTHQSFNDKTHPAPVPIPLFEIRHRSGPLELVLSGLPPLASVRTQDAVQGRTSTRLSIFEGTLRVWDPLRRFSVGIGQTLYNQSTHYLDAVEIPGTGERQFSRITGAHYELGYRVPYARGHIEATASYAPHMLGTQYTQYDLATVAPRFDPEIADQIDLAVRYAHHINPRAEIVLGLRYVNYTARYAEPNGTLSDRNVGVLPVFGYRTRIR